MENNTKIKYLFHELLMALRCKHVRIHGKYRCLLKVAIFAKSYLKNLMSIDVWDNFGTILETKCTLKT